MTDPQFLALVGLGAAAIAAIPPSIIAWSGRSKAAAAVEKADIVIEKATEIHTLTNSNLSQVTARLDLANEEIRGLRTLIATIAGSNGAKATGNVAPGKEESTK